MATKEMIQKAREMKKVYLNKSGARPKHYIDELENFFADSLLKNCKYCLNKSSCQNYEKEDGFCKDWDFKNF